MLFLSSFEIFKSDILYYDLLEILIVYYYGLFFINLLKVDFQYISNVIFHKSRGRAKNKLIQQSPTSWDYFFHQRESCWVLIHLNNGKLLGGQYDENSYASSYPNDKDIYIEKAWEVDEEGKFQKEIVLTKGVWISKESFDYIEFFRYIDSSEDLMKGGENNE